MTNSFQKEYAEIKTEINSAIKRVLTSGWYILGKEVVGFEEELARYLNIKYAAGVASGTDALTIALKVLGLGKGDGVIIPANVYPTAFGVAHAGVDIQLADVDPHTLNIDLPSIEKAVTSKTKAIIVIHLYGNPVDILPIKKFAKAKGLYLIEDCAQALGAKYMQKKVGTFGDIACFSFYPTKNLGAYGDGGAIAANNKSYIQKAKMWRMYGEKERYKSELIGMNSRLDEIQAACLRVKLKKLDTWNKKRRLAVKTYYEKLKNNQVVYPLALTPKSESIYHLFVIRSKNRDFIKKTLEKEGMVCGIHYPVPIHLTCSFKGLGYKKGDFPVSEKASDEILSLPINPYITEKEINEVYKSLTLIERIAKVNHR